MNATITPRYIRDDGWFFSFCSTFLLRVRFCHISTREKNPNKKQSGSRNSSRASRRYNREIAKLTRNSLPRLYERPFLSIAELFISIRGRGMMVVAVDGGSFRTPTHPSLQNKTQPLDGEWSASFLRSMSPVNNKYQKEAHKHFSKRQ